MILFKGCCVVLCTWFNVRMRSFNWDRMNKTPESTMIKGERHKGREELINAFERQASSDLDKYDRYGELKRDVEQRRDELLPEDNEAERALEEIVRKHEKTLRDDKGLEDQEEQKAYITALVRQIQNRKDRMH